MNEYKLRNVDKTTWSEFVRIAKEQNRTIKGALITAIEAYNLKYSTLK